VLQEIERFTQGLAELGAPVMAAARDGPLARTILGQGLVRNGRRQGAPAAQEGPQVVARVETDFRESAPRRPLAGGSSNLGAGWLVGEGAASASVSSTAAGCLEAFHQRRQGLPPARAERLLSLLPEYFLGGPGSLRPTLHWKPFQGDSARGVERTPLRVAHRELVQLLGGPALEVA
jgi:hypothetical protein